MVYTFYICNNEASANRFSSGNTFDIKEENLKNDKEAFEYALDLIDMLDMYEEDVDAEDLLYDQDTGEGNPVIYLIKRDEETIFDLDSDYFEKMRLSTEDDLNEDINFLDDNIEYKNHIIGKFNYDINYGDASSKVQSYLILSPYSIKGDKDNYNLPLYCEDEDGKVIEFETTDQAKDWLDKYYNKYKIQIKNGDEIHAVVSDPQDKIKELELERKRIEDILDRKSDQGVDFSSESDELDRIDSEINKIKNNINESLEDVEPNLYARITNAIKSELDAIDIYNDLIVYAEMEGRSDIAKLMYDIANEEKAHMGELQKALSEIDPNYQAEMQDGQQEADEFLSKQMRESLDKLLEYYHYEPEDVDLEFEDKQELIKD